MLRAAGLTYSHLFFSYDQSFSFKRTKKWVFSSQTTLQKPPMAAHLQQVSAVVLVVPWKALVRP